MSSTTEPQAALTANPNPYVRGNYAPIDFETTAFALRTTGTVPADLNGRLLRIGPNPTQRSGAARAHWFTGVGMVHGVRLSHGRAQWYRSRYVRAGSAAEQLGLDPVPGPASRADGAVNTTVLKIGTAAHACVEAGSFPVELTYELESRSRSDLGGGLTRGFAAHAKADPTSGEYVALAYQPGVPLVQYITVDVHGVAHQRGEISLPHMPLIHDVAITRRSVVVLDLPVIFASKLVAPGQFPYAWSGARDARVGLLPRDGDSTKLQWFEAPRCFVFHCLSAYDDDETVVLDVCRHPKMFASGEADIYEGKSIMARWTLNRSTGLLTEVILSDHGAEFPRINDAFESLPHRYGYSASAIDGGKLGPTLKYDLKTGTTTVHRYGEGRSAMEPIFIAREGAKSEDDGWILSYVYDTERDSTDIVILNAQDFQAPPVATIELPVRVPFGFHGNWLPDDLS